MNKSMNEYKIDGTSLGEPSDIKSVTEYIELIYYFQGTAEV